MMKIVTFNNHGTGHVLVSNIYTACGKRYPGAEGRLTDIGHSAAYPDGDLHLCRKCHHVIATGVKWFEALRRRHRKAGIQMP